MRSALVHAMRAVVHAAGTLGVPREAMLGALAMSESDLDRYDVRVPYAPAAAVWRTIETTLADPLCGLHIGRLIARENQAPLFQYTVRSAPTIADAWDQMTRMLRLLFADDYEPITRAIDDGWQVGYRLPLHAEPPIARSEECLVVTFVELCRAYAPLFQPSEITFQHAAAAPPAAWRKELGYPVVFDAELNSVRLAERAYRAPIRGHDPALGQMLEAFARPLIDRMQDAPAPADPAIRAIRQLLDRGEPVTVDSVARALHVSRRTLQRQLTAAGTSVRAELELARRDAALQLLHDARASIGEIAARLGFADASQLTRAVRRWTGATPSELRARARGG